MDDIALGISTIRVRYSVANTRRYTSVQHTIIIVNVKRLTRRKRNRRPRSFWKTLQTTCLKN